MEGRYIGVSPPSVLPGRLECIIRCTDCRRGWGDAASPRGLARAGGCARSQCGGGKGSHPFLLAIGAMLHTPPHTKRRINKTKATILYLIKIEDQKFRVNWPFLKNWFNCRFPYGFFIYP